MVTLKEMSVIYGRCIIKIDIKLIMLNYQFLFRIKCHMLSIILLMYMKKICIILTILLFIILNVNTAKANKCTNYKTINNLSTLNYKEFSYEDILKICTDEICTYLLDNNVDNLFKRHHQSYVSSINNQEKREWFNVHGVKIDTIYYLDCI